MKTKYEKFADSWKSVSLSTKLKYQPKQLHDNAIIAVMAQLIDTFGNDAKKLIANVCYHIGLSDGEVFSKQATNSGSTLSSIAEPIEIMCLLSGIEVDTKQEEGCVIVKMHECPYKDVLAGICDTRTVCDNHMLGLLRSRNKTAYFTHASEICEGCDFCEFVITIAIEELPDETE
ncbi:MAG: hypothetical protein KAH86_00160 [Methanosarcinales archaeon]|nr:hypothetical protein [Methanosarcinales archaeon]